MYIDTLECETVTFCMHYLMVVSAFMSITKTLFSLHGWLGGRQDKRQYNIEYCFGYRSEILR